MPVTDYITPPDTTPDNIKLGALKHKEEPYLKLDAALDDTITRPKEVHRSRRNKRWPMFGNGPDPTVTSNKALADNGCGDCVEVAVAKSIMHLYDGAAVKEPTVTADQVIDFYSKVTNFDPSQTDDWGNNPTDQGTDPMDAFNFWKTKGFPLRGGAVDQIVGYAGVDPHKPSHWERAIWEFDIISLSLALPVSAQGQTTWRVTDKSLTGDAAPGSWGGHEVPAVSYDGKNIAIYTWGSIYLATYEFVKAYCDLILVPLSKDILNNTGVSETGVNWDILNGDLRSL